MNSVQVFEFLDFGGSLRGRHAEREAPLLKPSEERFFAAGAQKTIKNESVALLPMAVKL